MLFLAFRTVTRGRWRRARWSFLLVTSCALFAYALTAVRYAFPGDSAAWIAWVSGLDVREVPLRPILTAVGRAVSDLPWGPLALRLNLLAALAGALTVGWVYRVVWFVVFDLMREESAVTHAPRNARFGGYVAALAVAGSLPFWQAATRFSPEIFDAALIMACAYVLTVYARSQNTRWLMLFGVLLGVGLAESELMYAAAPVLAFFAVIVEWRLFWCRIGRLFGAAALAFLVLCVTHWCAAQAFLAAYDLPQTRLEILRVVLAVLRAQVGELDALVPKTLWMPVLALGVGSSALSFFCALRMLDNRRTWGLLFLGAVLTVSAGLMLFHAPITPWAVLSPKGVMPATTYLLSGLGFGLLAASWRALSVLNDPLDVDIPVEEDDRADEERVGHEDDAPPAVFLAGRMTGFVLAPVLVVLILAACVCNGFRFTAESGAFADRAADVVLDGLKGRSWVVANGLIDPHLLVRAHERGIAVRLLCPYRATEKYYVAGILRDIAAEASFTADTKKRAQSLIAYNLHLFIDDLFATEKAIGDKAVCMGLPDLWYGSGWVPVAEGLFYGGVKSLAGVDADGLTARHRKFWEEWNPFLDQGEGSPKQLSYRYRLALRRHLSFLANNLGVTLDDLGKPNEAFSAYQKAREFSRENISALLNIFEMISRGFHQEMKDVIALELRRKVENTRERYPLWALSRHYGYVRNYELFVKMGWEWAMSSSPGSVLAGLRSVYSVEQNEDRRTALSAMMASVYEMRGDYTQSAEEYGKALRHDPKNAFAISGLVRLALQQSVVGEAQKILEAGEFAGVSKRLLRQDWAALYLVSGDLPRARVILQEMGDESSATPMTLAMLAMVMIEQQDVASVETKILPRLAKSTEAKDSYFVQVVQGRVWQSKGKEGFRNARLCYHRAAALRPDVQALRDVILMLDVSLEDQKAAEAHALSILRERPDHPFANFIMGSIRLEQAQYGDAEAFLRRSVAVAEPTLAALNNYAQVLCRIRKLDEAEAVARRAVARSPERYEAWSTLAFVLTSRDRLDEAAEAMAKAYAINSSDVRLLLVDGLIALKRGNRQTAEKAAAAVAEAKDLSAADRRELKNLQDALARSTPAAP